MKMRWAGHAARVEKLRNVSEFRWVKLEGKLGLGIYKRRCECNIKMDLKGM